MKNLLFLLLIFLCLQACEEKQDLQIPASSFDKGNLLASNDWEQKTDFGGIERYAALGFSIGEKGYIGGGYGTFGPLKDLWAYDPLTNSWSRQLNLPGSDFVSAFALNIDSRIYVGLSVPRGNNGVREINMWEYLDSCGTFEKRASYPGSGYQMVTAFTAGLYGYVGGGTEAYRDDPNYDRAAKKDFWRYDPVVNKWSRIADFEGDTPVEAVTFGIGKFGYVAMGNIGRESFILTNDIWEYNSEKNDWTQKADFPGVARAAAVGLSINNKGYIGTGRTSQLPGEVSDLWEYDPLSDRWSKKADFAGGNRIYATGFTLKGKGYLGTGNFEYDVAKKDFWEYTPSN